MNRLFEITKACFLSGFNTNKKKKNQSTSFKMMTLVGLIGLGISFMYNFMFVLSIEEKTMDAMNQYLVNVLVVATFLTLLIGIYQMKSAIFRTKDYEFLASLPLTDREVITSKLLAAYLMELFEDAIIIVPALIIYTIYTGNIYGLLIGFISLFFVSMIPLLLSSIIGTVVSIITARAKHKSVLTIASYVVFMVLVFSFSFSTSFAQSSGMDVASIDLSARVPYFKLVLNALDPIKFYQFLLFILINALSFVLVIFFISKVYKKINSIPEFSEHTELKKEDIGKREKNYLLKKELDSVLKRPNYLMNATSGLISYVVIAFVFMFMKFGEGEDESVTEMMIMMIPAFSIMMNSISPITAASISLEGKSFELLLSYPLDPKEVIRNKIKAGMIICAVPNAVITLLINIVAIFKIGFNPYFVVASILIPISTIIYSNMMGMVTGLRWPKIDFESEQQVYKNSAAVNFYMLFCALPGMFMTGIGVLLAVLCSVMEIAWLNTLFSVLYCLLPPITILLISLIPYNILKKRGVSNFYKVLR